MGSYLWKLMEIDSFHLPLSYLLLLAELGILVKSFYISECLMSGPPGLKDPISPPIVWNSVFCFVTCTLEFTVVVVVVIVVTMVVVALLRQGVM